MFRCRVVSLAIAFCASIGCRSPVPTVESAASNTTFVGARAAEISGSGACPPVQTVSFTQSDNEVSSATSPPEPLPAPLPANGDDVLSLADFEAIAFANNPTLVTAAARMAAARGRQVQAGLYPNPSIGYHATEIGNQGTAGAQGGFVSQKVVLGGKLGLDQAIAGQEFNEAHFRLHAQELRVLSDVRLRFYDVLTAERRVELAEELVRIGVELEQATQRLKDNRLGTENDLLQAQIRADESRLLLDSARADHAASWRRLAVISGIPEMTPTPLVGDLNATTPNFEWETLPASMLAGNPELIAARMRVQRAGAVVLRARREPIPDVELWASIRHQNVTGSDVANVQIGVPVPLFDRNQGAIRAAESELIAARTDLRRVEFALRDRLAAAFGQYQAARRQVERYQRRMIPAAERSLQLVTEGYRGGQVDYLTLLTAQQTFAQVSLAHLDSLQKLWAATVVIEGRMLSESLAATP